MLDVPLHGNQTSNLTPDFEVVIVYEDVAVGLQAQNLFDHLIRVPGEFYRFICHLWNFGILESAPLRDATTAEAAKADMIVFAVHEGKQLPHAVKEWIGLWVCKRKASSALVALVDVRDQRSDPAGPTRSHLRKVAEKEQMNFFSQEVHWPKRSLKFPVEITHTHVTKLASVQQPVPTQPIPAKPWWANE
jgi:hypothetical protein